MDKDSMDLRSCSLQKKIHLNLPKLPEGLDSILSSGKSLSTDGTNVIRVPFGVRQPRKKRPDKQEKYATLVLPFQPLGNPNPPPQAA
tara:strand:+ start:9803 stop:10063 length:261 start_codon:yes stop_codon:yes gene_type:complete